MQSYDDRAARLEPQTLAFLQALDAAGGPPLFALDPAAARLALAGGAVRFLAGLPFGAVLSAARL